MRAHARRLLGGAGSMGSGEDKSVNLDFSDSTGQWAVELLFRRYIPPGSQVRTSREVWHHFFELQKQNHRHFGR